MKHRTLLLVLALILHSFLPAGAATSPGRARRAEALYDAALRELATNTFDSRRVAIQKLEEATLLDPSNATYPLALARAYYQAGFLKNARLRFQRVVQLTPSDAEGRYGLGQVWRRDWLKYLDPTSLDRAIDNYNACVRLRPSHVDGWLGLVPLLVERDHLVEAAAAADSANRMGPRRPETLLAVGYTAYRRGQLALADSAFRAALPRLPRNVRDIFDEIGPVATEKDTADLHHLSRADQPEFLRRFWNNLDPDLATPENEAQLEYWARVTHAYFLFYNPRRREWDMRGEVYARYGPPARADYNPVGVSLYGWKGSPRNVLVWDYPELGMSVMLEDRLLSEAYMLPLSLYYDPDPRPDPDAAALQSDYLPSGEGRGVFHRLPPGVEPIPVRAAIARFEGEAGPLLMADVETASGPSDSLIAQWVVLDSTLTEVKRGTGALVPSACGAAERQSAQFAAELGPGRYVVGLSVRDGRGGRGVYRREVRLGAPDNDLSLSDVVIVCGTPDLARVAGTAAVRIEQNPAAMVSGGDPLRAYFEIYRLNADDRGQSRFEYVYTVRSTEKDPRIWLQRVFKPRPSIPQISATREEENAGSLRRQFLSVPIGTLPPGKYRLEVRVRDLNDGAEAERFAEFVKAPPGLVRN